jgi:serine/threonine protein kinase
VSEQADLSGTRIANYRLIRLLGQGRMGTVYLAQDEALLRPTAIKLLSWSLLESYGKEPEAWFLEEARNVARINHPAVVQIYNVAKHGNYCYIAMEYVEGSSGDDLIASRGPLSPVDASQIVIQIAGALHQAHSCSIIHRDIKPANVLVKPDGTAKLGDFGTALHASAATMKPSAPVGTPHFIAPEMWQGAPATPATDIYALGATYYCFLTGRTPFRTDDLATLIQAHVQSPVPDPRTLVPGIPAECSEILQGCLAKSPGDRYPSVRELRWALLGLVRALGSRGRAAETTRGSRRSPSSDSLSTRPEEPTQTAEPWMAALGLAVRPFGPLRDGHGPYWREPLRSIQEQLVSLIKAQQGRTVIVTGAPGSGRTALVRSAQAEVAESSLLSYIDLKHGEELTKVTHSLPAWAYGEPGAALQDSVPADAHLDGIVEHLSASPKPGVLVLDAIPEEPSIVSKLSVLARAAYRTKCMTLILVASPAFPSLVCSAEGIEPKAVSHLSIPDLNWQQTGAYLDAWLELARGPGSQPIVVTPDAAMLVCHRGGGNLTRINLLATNMLRMAAEANRRVLTSWYAWTASADTQENGARPETRVPAGWPLPEVLTLLNGYREGAKLPQRRAPHR